MDNITSTIENLAQKAEDYGKTTIELLKCNAVSKSADIFSNLAVKLVISTVGGMFLLFVNIGLAYWIGKELGEVYFGFFAVSLVYLLLAFILYIARNSLIRIPVSNFIISKMNKTDEI